MKAVHGWDGCFLELPNNINRDNGIEIPTAWMPTVKTHSRRMVQQRMPEVTTSLRNIVDQNARITADHRDLNGAE